MEADARIGQVLEGKYRLTHKLGQGGMGAVYAGENLRVRRSVAIKILHPGASSMREVVSRFELEARAAGAIGSEHVVEVFDLGTTESGERYMVMEQLDGEPLRARIRRVGRVEPLVAVDLFEQLLEGLSAAHRAGIIHRDLKPDNVFLVRERAKRPDFVYMMFFVL
jgi:serine/threonine-protein kinase